MGNSASTVMGRDKLPDLPIVGNQRKWNVAKVVLRCISLFLSIVDVGELIAIETGRNGLDYWPSVAYPVVSSSPKLRLFLHYDPYLLIRLSLVILLSVQCLCWLGPLF